MNVLIPTLFEDGSLKMQPEFIFVLDVELYVTLS